MLMPTDTTQQVVDMKGVDALVSGGFPAAGVWGGDKVPAPRFFCLKCGGECAGLSPLGTNSRRSFPESS